MGANLTEKADEAAPLPCGGTTGRDSVRPAARIEQLISVLETADAAFRSENQQAREQALSNGLAAVAALYGTLDSARSPETSTHLEAVYDACLRALGDAYGGDIEALSSAMTLARAIRSALRPGVSGAGPMAIRRAA